MPLAVPFGLVPHPSLPLDLSTLSPTRPERPQRLVRRLRLALVAVSMLAALLVLVVAGLLFYWSRYLLEPAGGAFARGPFLTRLTTDAAELRWTPNGRDPVELTATSGGRTLRASGGRFTGLAPGTTYAWTAVVRGRAAASGTFTTAPRALSAAPVRFDVIGDYGSGNEHEWAVGRVLAAGRPQFVLGAGDNSYLAAVPPVLDRNIFKPLRLAMANAPLWVALGEHDVVYRGGQATIDALHLPGDGRRYVVRYGPIEIVVLGVSADPAAMAFARRVLAVPGPRVRFVLVHRPLRPGHPLLPILRAARVQAVFAGHLHRYERRVTDGVRQYVSGVGGQGPGNLEFTKLGPGAVVSKLDFGLVRVAVSTRGVDYAFVDERGIVLDRDHQPPAPAP